MIDTIEYDDYSSIQKLLTPRELSRMLSVPLSTIYYWTHIQFIPYLKIGRHIRFKRATVLEWLSKRENKGRNSTKMRLDFTHPRIRRSQTGVSQRRLRGGPVPSGNIS